MWTPFDLAWAIIKEDEDEKFKPEPSRQIQLDGSYPKGHPTVPSYGARTPKITSKPTASMRTGPTPLVPSDADASGFMELGEQTAQEEENVQDYDAEKLEQLRQLLGIE